LDFAKSLRRDTREKVRYCEIRKALNVEPLLQIEISAAMACPRDQKAPEKNWRGPASNTHG